MHLSFTAPENSVINTERVLSSVLSKRNLDEPEESLTKPRRPIPEEFPCHPAHKLLSHLRSKSGLKLGAGIARPVLARGNPELLKGACVLTLTFLVQHFISRFQMPGSQGDISQAILLRRQLQQCRRIARHLHFRDCWLSGRRLCSRGLRRRRHALSKSPRNHANQGKQEITRARIHPITLYQGTRYTCLSSGHPCALTESF